ncbi:MAG: riboflavin synthase [Acidobacteria bacterium]|nr:riboflavin synthase [Acidobacteriota bacterium]
MFTGLIETVGRVEDATGGDAGMRLHVRTALADEMRPGESLAVNGVCLTVVTAEAGTVRADLGPETVRRTTLGSLRAGHPVNLERALRADGRVGGHFVQGHVDGTTELRRIRAEGDARWLTFRLDETLAAYVIVKGSIAVDGVSLTVAALRDDEFDVMIVPFTWTGTNLRLTQPGDRVNVECDMVGKYVARAAEIAQVEK